MSETLGNKNIPSGMPPMDSAFDNWMQPITLNRVTENVDDGLVRIQATPITFQGTVQPLSPKQITLKPEGQRSWTWLQIHCLIPGVLDTNDVVQYFGKNYKVMAVVDYSLNGYIEYHLVRDYQPRTP